MAVEKGQMWAADRIFSDDRTGRTRHLLEARLLARQSSEEICKLLSIQPRTVDIYEALYFNVKDRIDAKDWIAAEVITPVFQMGERPWQPDLMLKFFGYFGGPYMLDAVAHGIDTMSIQPKTPMEVNQYLDDTFKRVSRTQAVTFMTTYQPSRFDMRDLLGNFMSLLALQQREKEMEGEENLFTQAIEVLRYHHENQHTTSRS